MKIRTYAELMSFSTIEERYEYLKLNGKVGEEVFGRDRYLNQTFYHSKEWRNFRRNIIIRDNGCDLAHEDYPINGPIYIHHMNPITIADVKGDISKMLDPDQVVCCSYNMHQAITYGLDNLAPKTYVPRRPYDDCPWR